MVIVTSFSRLIHQTQRKNTSLLSNVSVIAHLNTLIVTDKVIWYKSIFIDTINSLPKLTLLMSYQMYWHSRVLRRIFISVNVTRIYQCPMLSTRLDILEMHVLFPNPQFYQKFFSIYFDRLVSFSHRG